MNVEYLSSISTFDTDQIYYTNEMWILSIVPERRLEIKKLHLKHSLPSFQPSEYTIQPSQLHLKFQGSNKTLQNTHTTEEHTLTKGKKRR
jgi:hypothetical protein